MGLAGEPDGDVVVHVACNALLTAADLGDLGAHFDTSTPEWEGAAPTVLLAETARLVRDSGFAIGNVSVQLIGERPKLGPHRAEAQKVLAAALGAPVFLGAATPEGLGWSGCPGCGRGSRRGSRWRAGRARCCEPGWDES
ncbi:2-C-methyl-D-erythritol 2,4-cyclodiphosphate synthase [Streptomyces malaysiensis]|uniref:2-C-methyl-D-erythritol 2,4-cyclodiphosphate synthase n=1 Tax=Streptomyces malaysiensis TaxID=92644 RepID=UPI0035565BC0